MLLGGKVLTTRLNTQAIRHGLHAMLSYASTVGFLKNIICVYSFCSFIGMLSYEHHSFNAGIFEFVLLILDIYYLMIM